MRRRSRRWFHERVLIIGRVPLTEQILAEAGERLGRRIIVGIVDDLPSSDANSSICPVLGSLSQLSGIIDQWKPDRVIMALTERRRRMPINALVESCVTRGIHVEDAAEFYERLTGKLAIESLTPTSIVYSRRFGPSRLHQLVTRILSVAMAILGLILSAPLIALIAIAIKCESDGPVLFVQPRVGAAGRPFNLMKFRTMRIVSHRVSEWEHDNRDRVTRIGRWLRAFRLDELPQFINVLRGEMNVIGPRPHPVSNYELFTLVCRNLNELTGAAFGYYTLRSMVRPGITGWAQVRYRYANNIEEEIEKLRYDLFYVKYASIALDLRVLLQTIKVILLGHQGMIAASGPRAAAPSAIRSDAARPVHLPPDVTGAHAA